MWARKYQLMVGTILFFVILFLFTSNARIAEYASSLSMPSSWKKRPLKVAEKPILPSSSSPVAQITETTLPLGTPASGFTLFDRLYVRNGTLYVVTSNPGALPHLKFIISKPEDRGSGKDMDPTSKEIQIIAPEQAQEYLGTHAVVVPGMSMILYDTKQFMAHYYHWWGEIILGAMRVYSGLTLLPKFQPPLPDVSRFILPHVSDDSWRDHAGVNGPLMRAGFPMSSIERADLWKDFIALNQTFVFERSMVVSRTAAHQSPLSNEWFKMIASTMNMTAPEHFWEPLRQRLVANAIGYLPILDSAGVVVTSPKSSAPVVTYVSRQSTGRRLTEEDHRGLLRALEELESEGLCELNVAVMENMTFSEQIETVARSTIIVGVHGNGLTHQIWMPPSPRSTILEIFYPKGYLHDYEILARNMGHKHYAVWNDTTLTYPPGQWFKGVDALDRSTFHGSSIPVHGPTVTEVVRERLTMRVP